MGYEISYPYRFRAVGSARVASDCVERQRHPSGRPHQLPHLCARQLVGARHSERTRRPRFRRDPSLHRRQASPPGLRPATVRDSLCNRLLERASPTRRVRRLSRRKGRGSARTTRLSPSGRGENPIGFHRRRGARRRHRRGSAPARARPRSKAPVRNVGDPLERAGESLGGGLGRGGRLVFQCAKAGGVDVGRCGRTRYSSWTGTLRRGVRRR